MAQSTLKTLGSDSLTSALLQEAVSYLSESFENSEEVDGANLVEWFSEWRLRAKKALEHTKK